MTILSPLCIICGRRMPYVEHDKARGAAIYHCCGQDRAVRADDPEAAGAELEDKAARRRRQGRERTRRHRQQGRQAHLAGPGEPDSVGTSPRADVTLSPLTGAQV